jgi:hypothetical protein
VRLWLTGMLRVPIRFPVHVDTPVTREPHEVSPIDQKILRQSLKKVTYRRHSMTPKNRVGGMFDQWPGQRGDPCGVA